MTREPINEIRESVEIDLQKLLLAYLHKWWLIVLCALIAGGATLYYTVNHITPQYRAGVSIYVNNTTSDQQMDSISSANISASKQLVATYINIINSDRVLDRVAEELNNDYSSEKIRKMMSAEQMDNTEIFEIFITHPSAAEAARIANAVADVAPVEIASLIEGSSARIIDHAKVPTARYSPSYQKNTAFGAVVGVLAAVIYITLRHLMDVRLKTEEDLRSLFDVPVLGRIPEFESTDAKKSGRGYETKAAGREEQ